MLCHMAESSQRAAGKVKRGYVIIRFTACVKWPVRYSLMLSHLSCVDRLLPDSIAYCSVWQFLSSLDDSRMLRVNKANSDVCRVAGFPIYHLTSLVENVLLNCLYSTVTYRCNLTVVWNTAECDECWCRKCYFVTENCGSYVLYSLDDLCLSRNVSLPRHSC